MGRRGPKPKTTAQGEMDGDWRTKARKKAGREPPNIGEPVKPLWLSEAEGEVWDQMVVMLRGMGVLDAVPGNVLMRYCAAFVRWKGVAEFVREKGEVYTIRDKATAAQLAAGKPGDVRCVMPWPQVAIEKSLREGLLKIEQEMGLTPAARTRVVVTKKPTAASGSLEEFNGPMRLAQ